MSHAVVITGCSSGIGEACARHLHRLGWRVFAGVRRGADADRLRAAGPGMEPVILDVTDAGSIRAAAAAVATALAGAGVDGLVNNAGIARGGAMEFVPLDLLRRQFEVNVFGLVAVTQAFLPLLHAAQGRIVNIGSVSGRFTSPLLGPYAASKHAVEAITDALRLELAGAGIQVSVVEPGVVSTPIWEKAERDESGQIEALPPEGRARYGTLAAGLLAVVRTASRRGIPMPRVLAAVEHALTARRPHTRYLIGGNARVRVMMQALLPRRWTDAIILRALRRAASASP